MTYNVFLIPAALFGLAVFIYQLDCYSKGASYEAFDSLLNPIFGIFLAFWSTNFVEYWTKI